MRHTTLGGIILTVVVALAVGSIQTAEAQETGNDLPNPYQAISGWAKMPGARHWGATSAVDIDPDGVHVWVAERCGQNACEGSDSRFDPEVRQLRLARQELRGRQDQLAARYPCRHRRQCVGDRRARRQREGTSGPQVQPGRRPADESWHGR